MPWWFIQQRDIVLVAAVFRFFVLNNEAGLLEYFVNEQSRHQKPRGMLPLAGAVISPSDEDSHTFTVNAISGEQYKLRGGYLSLTHTPISWHLCLDIIISQTTVHHVNLLFPPFTVEVMCPYFSFIPPLSLPPGLLSSPSIRFIQYWSGCFPLSAASEAESHRNWCWVRSS